MHAETNELSEMSPGFFFSFSLSFHFSLSLCTEIFAPMAYFLKK